MRIVSLLPSATEIVYALGLGDQLAGVTFECDTPPEARQRHPVLVGGAVPEGLDPAAIDALVRERVAAGAELYQLDQDALAAIAPDLLLTQDLCRVCAMPAATADEAMSAIGCTGEVLTLDPHRLTDVLATIATVAERAGVGPRGDAVVADLEARLAAVAAAVAGRGQPATFVLEWVEPPFAAGHWVPDLVTAAGGRPVVAAAGERSVTTTWAAVAAAEPDVVVAAPCGFGLADAVAQTTAILPHLPPSAEVWAIDSAAYVVRPGPRLVDGVEAIAHALHPEAVAAPPPGRLARLR